MKLLNLYSLFLLRVGGILKEDGWFRSFQEGRSVDSQGKPIPWITYSAIEFIQRRITSEMNVFEYGCGSSTLWWAGRVNEVVACEHDFAWYQDVTRKLPVNATIHHVPLVYGGDYSRLVSTLGRTFDVVVIDGRDRVNCAINALTALTPAGVIIWDNSDRAEYQEGCRHLLDHGFRKIEFVGIAPIMVFKTETSIFYRPNNCFGI
jgi:hypothetical protein